MSVYIRVPHKAGVYNYTDAIWDFTFESFEEVSPHIPARRLKVGERSESFDL